MPSERIPAPSSLSRRSGEVRARAYGEPFFCFHHLNAFEEGGALVVDLVACEDAEIVEALYLDRVRGEGTLPYFDLRRYHVRLDGGEARPEAIAPGMELPRIDCRRHNARPYRYAYGMGFDHEGGGRGSSPGSRRRTSTRNPRSSGMSPAPTLSRPSSYRLQAPPARTMASCSRWFSSRQPKPRFF